MTPVSSTAASWRATSWRWLGLCLTALITFILVRIAVLNVFYTTGDMHDPGWIASVTWHNTWHLHGPPAFHSPYFSEHLAPMLWLTNAVSFVLPLAKFDYYAALIGAIHALYAAPIYRAWQLSDSRITSGRAVVAILVALAAAFSGVAVVALGLPHPELAIPAPALWFFIAMARRAYLAAACWLAKMPDCTCSCCYCHGLAWCGGGSGSSLRTSNGWCDLRSPLWVTQSWPSSPSASSSRPATFWHVPTSDNHRSITSPRISFWIGCISI